jgi:phage/plasmid-associated DNA primase
VLEAVSQEQQKLVNQEDIDVYTLDRNFVGPGSREINAKDAYRDYQQWAVDNGMRSVLNFIWFCRKICNKKVPSRRDRDENNQYQRYFTVSDSCPIGVFNKTNTKLLEFKK